MTWTFETEDNTVFLNGANTIDISGEGTKEYKFSIYGLKMGNNKITIVFKNPATFEFISFKIVILCLLNIRL